MEPRKFKFWAEVLAHVDAGGELAYAAPLDLKARRVIVLKRFKNGKLRLDPLTNQVDPFTADSGHLDRMRYA